MQVFPLNLSGETLSITKTEGFYYGKNTIQVYVFKTSFKLKDKIPPLQRDEKNLYDKKNYKPKPTDN